MKRLVLWLLASGLVAGPLEAQGLREKIGELPTSADQYAATLARWFGIADVDLNVVAPNLGNFAQRDLGFMIG